MNKKTIILVNEEGIEIRKFITDRQSVIMRRIAAKYLIMEIDISDDATVIVTVDDDDEAFEKKAEEFFAARYGE